MPVSGAFRSMRGGSTESFMSLPWNRDYRGNVFVGRQSCAIISAAPRENQSRTIGRTTMARKRKTAKPKQKTSGASKPEAGERDALDEIPEKAESDLLDVSPETKRLWAIAGEISALHEKVKDWRREYPGKRGQPAPKPNPILRTHYEIGQLVNEYARIHKKIHGRGYDAYKALSTMLQGAMKTSHLRNHGRYGELLPEMVEGHVEEGKAWREVERTNPKKDLAADDFGL